MKRELKKIIGLLTESELRRWLFYKLWNPSDKGLVVKRDSCPYFFHVNVSNLKLLKDNVPVLIVSNLRKVNFETLKIELASQSFFIEKVSELNFIYKDSLEKKLRDCEDQEAIFRFAFLLRDLEENKGYQNISCDVIKQWIFEYQHAPKVAFEPYTISERLVNFSIFLFRTKVFLNWSDEWRLKLEVAIKNDLTKLINNLEYLGEDLTCNHLLNNFRAIAWSSALLGSPELFKEVFIFIQKEMKRVFQDDGMNREGSSHYQLLFNRNISDCLFLSEYFQEKSFSDFLKTELQKISNASKMFFVDEKIPLFGDISPDIKWTLLKDVPWMYEKESRDTSREKARGWVSHFNTYVFKEPVKLERLLSFDDFTLIQNKDWKVFSRYNPRGYPLLNSHSHCDSAAPVVFYKGEEILSDLGRVSYQPHHQFYLESVWHNSFLIDEGSLEIPQRAFFGKGYKEKRFGTITRKIEDSYISYMFKGYFSGLVDFEREIAINDGLNLSYTLKRYPRNKTKLKLFFYSKTLTRENFSFSKPGDFFQKELDVYSSCYGQSQRIRQFEWSGRCIVGEAIKVRIEKIQES